MTTAGNLLLMIGTDSLDEGSRRDLLAEGWRFYADDSVSLPAMLWFALKVADGLEGTYTFFYEGSTCPGTAEGYLVVIELNGGGITPVWAIDTVGVGTPVTWPAVTMLGQGIVFAVTVVAAGGTPLVTAPAGYTLVDSYTFTNCPDTEFLVWSNTVVAGVETPGPSDDPVVSWCALTIGLHAFEANVLELGLIDITPSPVGTPVSDGTDTGEATTPRPDDAFPLPPNPSGIIVPGPTWKEG